jgi:hypothetical protein
MTNLFARAASSLLGDRPEGSGAADVRSLLEALEYAAGPEFPADGGESGSETYHRALLLKAASRFARVFQLVAPDAPGLACFGAEFDPATAEPLHSASLWPAFPARVCRCSKHFRDVSARGSSISLNCRPRVTCWFRLVSVIPLPSLARRRGTSSPRSRHTGCIPMPNFHGTMPRGAHRRLRARGGRAQREGPGSSAARDDDQCGSMSVAATGAGAPATPGHWHDRSRRRVAAHCGSFGTSRH